MKILGGACAGVGALLYLVSLRLAAGMPASRGESTMGTAFSLAFVLIPLWAFLAISLSVATAGGGLDWLSVPRGVQYLSAVGICLAMAVVSWFAWAMAPEPSDQIPWAVRPLVPWAAYVLAPAVLLFVAAALHGRAESPGPPLAFRVPFGLACLISLLSVCGLLLQAAASSVERDQKRAAEIVRTGDERHQRQLDEVRGLDAVKSFGELLSYTNRYNQEDVRNLALEKLRSDPDFQGSLSEALRNQWVLNALVFLDASDPPDPRATAAPARDAIEAVAASVRDAVRTTAMLRADDFEYQARLSMSAADRLRGQGVDFAPAIREFRRALDEPRRDPVVFDCAAALDSWIAREAKGTK